MKRLAPILAISAMLLAAPPAFPQSGDAVDAIFSKYTGDRTPGCVIGVAKDGKVLLERAYGMADIEKGVTARLDSIYEMGSVSKQFAAAAILLLARDGKLSLTDDIRKYLPEMPDYGARITIRDLLQHTSGLREFGSIISLEGWPRNSRTIDNADVLAIVTRQRALNFAPGTHYNYSNTNFILAAIIVGRVSGERLAAFTKKRIFDPLGMTKTHWRERYQDLVPDRATAYSRRGNRYVIDQPIEDIYGNGGLLTTLADALNWNAALDADKLGAGFREAMERVGVLKDGTRINYASGLFVKKYRGADEISHTGATAGYKAYLARYPAQRLSIALLCNAGDVSPGTIGHRVADLYLVGLDPLGSFSGAGGALPTGLFVSELTGIPISIAADANGNLTADGAPLTRLAVNQWRLLDADFTFDRYNGLVIEEMGDRRRYRRLTPVKAADPKPYLGRYCGTDNGFCLTVARDPKGGLSIATSGRPGLAPVTVKVVAADMFTNDYMTVHFVRDMSGQIRRLSYSDSRTWGVIFDRKAPVNTNESAK